MRVSSRFTTAILAMLLAQPVLSANLEIKAGEVRDSVAVAKDNDSVDLRRALHGRNRWRVHEEAVEVRASVSKKASRVRDTTNTDDATSDSDTTSDSAADNDDSNADDAQTTLQTSIAAMTSPNTWVMVQHVTGTSYSTVTVSPHPRSNTPPPKDLFSSIFVQTDTNSHVPSA